MASNFGVRVRYWDIYLIFIAVMPVLLLSLMAMDITTKNNVCMTRNAREFLKPQAYV